VDINLVAFDMAEVGNHVALGTEVSFEGKAFIVAKAKTGNGAEAESRRMRLANR
jgi:hypothetical protein